MDMQFRPRITAAGLTRAGVNGALYAALTLLAYPISFGAVQLRLSEVLTVLPLFFPEAVPGLFIGCVAANLLSPNIAVLDVLFGSLATLIAAFLTRRLRNRHPFIALLPPVLLNAVIVGAVITLSVGSSEDTGVGLFAVNCAAVGLGEALSCLGLGLPLVYALRRAARKIEKKPPENQ